MTNPSDDGGPNTHQACHEKLRDEIVESQKILAEFVRWKLIAVAGVAAAWLGLELPHAAAISTQWLPCLIPLVCAYVDSSSIHIMLRILLIGIYLKNAGDPYEKFIFQVRDKQKRGPFLFEIGALYGSSGIFNLIVGVIGFVIAYFTHEWAYIAAGCLGCLGLLATAILLHMHRQSAEVIRSAAENYNR